MLQVTGSIAIREDELTESFVRASGPGGQHVNTTSSAVDLRFDALHSPSLPDDMKARLAALAGQRMTRDGVVVIRADGRRSQALNRADALERLLALLREAAYRKPVRRPTRPTLASERRRRDAKGRRAAVKSLRRDARRHDDS